MEGVWHRQVFGIIHPPRCEAIGGDRRIPEPRGPACMGGISALPPPPTGPATPVRAGPPPRTQNNLLCVIQVSRRNTDSGVPI